MEWKFIFFKLQRFLRTAYTNHDNYSGSVWWATSKFGSWYFFFQISKSSFYGFPAFRGILTQSIAEVLIFFLFFSYEIDVGLTILEGNRSVWDTLQIRYWFSRNFVQNWLETKIFVPVSEPQFVRGGQPHPWRSWETMHSTCRLFPNHHFRRWGLNFVLVTSNHKLVSFYHFCLSCSFSERVKFQSLVS